MCDPLWGFSTLSDDLLLTHLEVTMVDCFLDTHSLEIGSESSSKDARDRGVPQVLSDSFKVFWWVILPKQIRLFPLGLKWAPEVLKVFVTRHLSESDLCVGSLYSKGSFFELFLFLQKMIKENDGKFKCQSEIVI